MNLRPNIILSISSEPEKVTKNIPSDPCDIFGKYVFNEKIMEQRLPKDVFKKLKKTASDKHPIDPEISDVVASAMKDWAVEHGATHYTHWFQPLTGSTAEKHDSFLTPKDANNLILGFSGKDLIKGEPDASSFPSGGIRATFEARGYTAWDPTSPAFIRKTDFGSTLFIPTAFCSYTGEALDLKTPLLRSQEAISKNAVRLLKMLGSNATKVFTTAGLEQEYFLIDKKLYLQRPDLVASGRTLFGNSPFKGQELEDHYFGTIRPRVLSFMMDVEQELYKLGIPIKTRHNEVAPAQYEIAPVFVEANIAVDQNLLTMDVMSAVADKHGLKILFHEKPFAGVNGSGKHCNWSMADSEGNNLLDPGDTPMDNMKFIVFLTAIIRSIDKYAKLLRISVAHAGNDHRLGANEAPPAIISTFLGEELERVVENIVSGSNTKSKGQQKMTLGVSTLPPLPKDNTDRNRTSPLAFTGNKFEFRALGSSQSASGPNYIMNTAVAESLEYIADKIEAGLSKGENLNDVTNNVVKEILTQHKRVIFNGDGYSEDWFEEAAKRGLPNMKNTIDAFKTFDEADHVALMTKMKVLTENELTSRKIVHIEKYNKMLEVEIKASLDITSTIILPAMIKHRDNLCGSYKNAKDLGIKGMENELKEIDSITSTINQVIAANENIRNMEHSLPEDIIEKAEVISKKIIPAMNDLRDLVDSVESKIDDNLWTLPKYREMLMTF